jgi:hypothetical protein
MNNSLHADKMCELMELYALGGLSEEEKAAFERHAVECADCRSQLFELEALVELLPMASEPVKLPAGMRDRVLGRVFNHTASNDGVKKESMAPRSASRSGVQAKSKNNETDPRDWGIVNESRGARRTQPHTDVGAGEKGLEGNVGERSRRTVRTDRRTSYWRWISIGLTAAVLLIGFYGYKLRDNMKQLQTELASAMNELKAAQTELTAMNKPAEALKVNQIVSLNPAAENVVSKGLASIVDDGKGTHLIVQAENLPELQKEQAFQVWLIKDDQPINAGTFYPHNGSGAIYYTFEQKNYDTVTITLEPDAHGEKPRGAIVLAAGLKS